MVAPSSRAFLTVSTVFASMLVLSITVFTAPCSVPPSEVKSFWYSMRTTAVDFGSIVSLPLFRTGARLAGRDRRPRNIWTDSAPKARGAALLPRHLEREPPTQGLAVFAGRLDHHPIGSGRQIGGQAGGPDVGGIVGADPGLLGRLVAGEHLLDERIGPGAAGHLHRRPVADDHLDPGLVAAVEHVGDQRRSAQGVARQRRTQERQLTEIAVGVLADPVEAAVDRQSHLPSVRLFGRNEAGPIIKTVDRKDVEAVG